MIGHILSQCATKTIVYGERRVRGVEMADDHNERSNNFDPTSPCLVLAPHLEYPLRNGGDILIDKKWSRLSEYVRFVDIIGKNTITRYENGSLARREH